MLYRTTIFVTGLPGSGKTILSLKMLEILLRKRVPSIYINVGELSIRLGLVTEYDFLHDTYTPDYEALKQKIIEVIKKFKEKVGSRASFIIVESHDFCFLNHLAESMGPFKSLVLFPKDKSAYEKILENKNWPYVKKEENIEYYEFAFFIEDECFKAFVENNDVMCICDLDYALHNIYYIIGL